MPHRHIHLVGSYPAADVRQAMTVMAGVAGPYLRTLADGEVGARRYWIRHIIEDLRENPDVELRADGGWSGYDDHPIFKVRRGHRLRPGALRLGTAQAAGESYAVFKQVRAEHRLDGVAFQVGVPSDLDLALFSFGPARALALRRAFREALAREMREIAAWGGRDVLFQIEVPAELVMVATVPGPLRTPVARLLVGGLIKLVVAVPPDSRFGVHLCVGDLNNRALKRLGTLAPVVSLVKALLRAWPHDRALEFVHVPLAAGDRPPPLKTAFYQGLEPLADLPPGIRFVAGLAHEAQGPDDQRRVLRTVERVLSRTVDVASACGLGRRSEGDARRALDRAVALAES
ncbi:hypothetical protein SAMN05444920_11920 [Nonomuraea solani]|uniref:Methionine synthase n=1 Tax=Nonomuraea solani TaxID=1144553 RepID=A0A1H6ETA5_9ACTN|nr:hypothetical protein [Nonomuraea solani]SEH01090.1 hypothetical protein SAMN05444920_11920 [Nonomuraea solani]